MKTFWLAVAGICVCVAAVLLLRGSFDAAFVVAVLGMMAWFLNYRMQVKTVLAAKDIEQEENMEGKDIDEEK